MSNQSGITASQDLLDLLASTVSDAASGPLDPVVAAEISPDNTAVVLHKTFPDHTQLQSYVKSLYSPLYIFVKSGPQLHFIAYVPEDAPVRSKMLYASTKNTLLRQVGSNHIAQNLLLSVPEELAPESWETDDNDAGAVLTESERVNLKIAHQQQRDVVRGGRQLVSQTGGTSQTLSFKISSSQPIPELLQTHNVVSFVIDLQKEQVEVQDTAQISQKSELPVLINTEHPSYTIYASNGNYYFIYSCPSGSKVKERMLYASNKSGFVKHLLEHDHLTMQKIFEIGDPEELELAEIEPAPAVAESANPSAGQLKFNRPKRPGRRS